MQGIVKGGLNDGGSNIKSMQSGTTSFTASSATQTITSVNMNNSVLIMSCFNTAGDALPSKELVRGRITSSTQLTFNRGDIGSNEVVAWTVIEFNNVKSLQRGTKSLSNNNTEQTQAVTSVNVNKSIIFATMSNTTATTAPQVYPLKSRVIDSLTIGFQAGLFGSATVNVDWQLIEFM